MRKVYFYLFPIIFLNAQATCGQQAEKTLDSLTTAKLSISGFCVCKTRITNLETMADDFKEVDVEEMDYPKKCGGLDTRFTGERGFYSEKFRGMIFSKGKLIRLYRKDQAHEGF